ncbi:hypothetical protein EYF80_045289 [Liparis tanakae]|uniref:Uncharacterized protein n=1 Tax=Liparis tanakae TaxID=230148 RepID=A0A4Z2FUN3_9TELE|nr:hypothetical protein EYF80_045289 [Liparis tanakae]
MSGYFFFFFIIIVTFDLARFRLRKRREDLRVGRRDNLETERRGINKKLSKQTDIRRREAACRGADLAAVEVDQPQVVGHLEVGFVEEEAGGDADDVGGRGEKQLGGETHSGATLHFFAPVVPGAGHTCSAEAMHVGSKGMTGNMYSRGTQLRTWRQASTPSSSRGRCKGKSTMEKRELSGRAKVSARLSSLGRTSTSTRRWPATGTGERSNRYTQDSISRRSASSWLHFSSTDSTPVNTRHMRIDAQLKSSSSINRHSGYQAERNKLLEIVSALEETRFAGI